MGTLCSFWGLTFSFFGLEGVGGYKLDKISCFITSTEWGIN